MSQPLLAVRLEQFEELRAAGVSVHLLDANWAIVAGLRCRIIDDSHEQPAAAIICAPKGHFADDVQTHCDLCGADIVHRPDVPAESMKLCARCGQKMLQAG